MDRKTLLEATKMRLAAQKLPLREVAAGSGVGYEWLAKFSQGRIGDPGVRKVQALHDFLASRESA